MRRIAPAIALFLFAPLIGEFLLGNLPITLLFALVLLAPMYGGGALLIRETVRRRGQGWPSILCLAVAYALVEEGLVTQSLFNPNYVHLRLLDPGYVPWLGIGVPWTVFVLALHVIWSVGTPIVMAEALVPARRHQPWLGRVGLTAVAVLFVLGAAGNAAITFGSESFMAPWPRLVVAGLLAVLMVVVGLRLPRRSAVPAGSEGSAVPEGSVRAVGPVRAAPGPVLVGVLAVVAGSVFQELHLLADLITDWGGVVVLVLLLAGTVLTVRAWSARPGWGPMHELALGIGAMAVYAWHSFVEKAAVQAGPPLVDHLGDAVFSGLAVLLAVIAIRRGRAAQDRAAQDRAAQDRAAVEAGRAVRGVGR